MLDGKIVLVTGASRGIGNAIALTLGKAGATVIGTATSDMGAVQISKMFVDNKILGLGKVLDVTDKDQITNLMESINQDFGSIDILVNNAGITRDNILLRMKSEEWNQVMNVNLNGPFHLTKTVLKDMVKNKNGRIINISSISGTDGNKGQGNYAASKGGLLALTKSLAKEVGRRNITVNCIAPGLIETDMTSHLSESVKKGYLDRIPLKRLGKPKDIGQMILFLCSDEASYITGQTFYIDGGMSLN